MEEKLREVKMLTKIISLSCYKVNSLKPKISQNNTTDVLNFICLG